MTGRHGEVFKLFTVRASTAEKNRDYLEVADTVFMRDATLKAAIFWREGHPQVAFFDDWQSGIFLEAIANEFSNQDHILEIAQLQSRKSFLDRHGISSTDWKPEFTKMYPERDLILDEITVFVRIFCMKHRNEMGDHLLRKQQSITRELNELADNDPVWNSRMARNGPSLISERLHLYRVEYGREYAGKMKKQLLAEVAKLDSIQGLYRKVKSIK